MRTHSHTHKRTWNQPSTWKITQEHAHEYRFNTPSLTYPFTIHRPHMRLHIHIHTHTHTHKHPHTKHPHTQWRATHNQELKHARTHTHSHNNKYQNTIIYAYTPHSHTPMLALYDRYEHVCVCVVLVKSPDLSMSPAGSPSTPWAPAVAALAVLRAHPCPPAAPALILSSGSLVLFFADFEHRAFAEHSGHICNKT